MLNFLYLELLGGGLPVKKNTLYQYLRIFENYPYLEKYGLLLYDIFLWKVLSSISDFLLELVLNLARWQISPIL